MVEVRVASQENRRDSPCFWWEEDEGPADWAVASGALVRCSALTAGAPGLRVWRWH